jgi:hypothetical protein
MYRKWPDSGFLESGPEQFGPAKCVPRDVWKDLLKFIDRHYGDGLDSRTPGEILLEDFVGICVEEKCFDRWFVTDKDRVDSGGRRRGADFAVLHSFAGRCQLQQCFRCALLVLNEFPIEILHECGFVDSSLRQLGQ